MLKPFKWLKNVATDIFSGLAFPLPTDADFEITGTTKIDSPPLPACRIECQKERSQTCEAVKCFSGAAHGYCCTRPKGHSGDHVACGGKSHAVCVWGQG